MPQIAENVKHYDVVSSLDIPGTGKFIILAMLQHKTTDVARLMELTGEERRTVQMYRRQWLVLMDENGENDEAGCAKFAKIAKPVSCDDDGQSTSANIENARDYTETPSELSSTEEKIDPPLTPPSPMQSRSWEDDVASQTASHPTITVENGKAILHNGTRAEWLARFGGDEEDLELALIDAVGTIQPNSRQDPAVQITRRLSIIVRDRREKDKRYAAAVASSRKAAAKPAAKLSRW